MIERGGAPPVTPPDAVHRGPAPAGALPYHAGMDAPPTADLVRSAAGGDQQAWDGLVERYGRLVWSVIRGFRLDAATAADVSQTTWLRLVEHLDRLREPDRVGSWLATTARNECLRVYRRSARTIPSELPGDITDPRLRPDERVILDEEAGAVLAALELVPEQCRELLRLIVADPPLSYQDIAEVLGRPLGSIGPTRQRCLDRLRAALTTIDSGSERRPR